MDGVRGLAALLVVYTHLFLRWVPPSPKPVFWARTLSGMSWTGVDLFFILSGFLIGGILLRNREAANYFGVFYVRRAFRILPLYFAFLAIFFGLRFGCAVGGHESFAQGGVPFWSYLLLVQNFPMALTGAWGAGPLGVTWSVALEEQFYLFLPLLIRLVPLKALLAVFAGLAALGPVARVALPVAAPTFLLPGSLEPFFAGVILAWFYLHRPTVFAAARWRRLAAALFVLGGGCMAWMAVRGGFGPFRETGITLFWGAFLWLVLAWMGSGVTAPLRWKPLCWVGGVSYGVYLLHPLVAHLIFLGVFGAPPANSMGMGGFGLTCLAMALIFAITGLSARFFERPLMAIGHRYAYRKPGEGAVAAGFRP